MKNVLVVASFYPYCQGSKRVIGLARNLPKVGWNPIILTPPLRYHPEDEFNIVETKRRDPIQSLKKLMGLDIDKDLRMQVKERLGISHQNSWVDKAFNLGGMIVNYPDSFRDWKKYALESANQIIQNNKIDALLSIHPIMCHIVCNELKAKYGIPWIADYPDLWSQNAVYTYGSFRQYFDRKLELKTMRIADALITTSYPWAVDELAMIHKDKSIYSITHGFDQSNINDPPSKLTTKFTITYTGIIYTGKRNPLLILMAIKELIANGQIDNNDIEVRYYGPHENWLDIEIEKLGLSAIVKQYGIVPYLDSIQKQRESQLLLLLDWDDAKDKGVYTGKVFEYLGARRPIVATGGVRRNAIDELLRQTKAGTQTTTIEDVKEVIANLYQEYKLKGKVIYQGKESEVSKYSHLRMAEQFAGILDGLIKGENV